MAVGCGAQCAKIMLIIFNAIFWLSGAAILGVGIWLRVDPTIIKYLNVVTIDAADSDRYLEYAAYLLIGLGAFVFLVGMLGCCGAIRENRFCLGLYIFLLVIVMAGEIAAGVLAILFRNQIETNLEENARKKLKEKGFNMNQTFGQALAFVQLKRGCCGINDYNDYDDYVKKNSFPRTCCILADGKDKKDIDPIDLKDSDLKGYDQCKAKENGYYYQSGCKQAMVDFVDQNAIIMIGVGLGIACLELFGFIFAICLCRNVGEEA